MTTTVIAFISGFILGGVTMLLAAYLAYVGSEDE